MSIASSLGHRSGLDHDHTAQDNSGILKNLVSAVWSLEQQVARLADVQADHASTLQERIAASKHEVMKCIVENFHGPPACPESPSRAAHTGGVMFIEPLSAGRRAEPDDTVGTHVLWQSHRTPTATAKSATLRSSSTTADDAFYPVPRQREVTCLADLLSLQKQVDDARQGSKSATSSDFRRNYRTGGVLSLMDCCSLRRCSLSRLLPLRAHGPPRLSLDILSFLFLLYDAVAVPYYLAWPADDSPFTFGIRVAACAFWTSDLFLSFVSSRTNLSGTTIDDWRGIALQYLRTWFLIDIMLLAVDWLDFMLDGGKTDDFHGATLLRVTRFLRFGRMLRIIATIFSDRLSSLSIQLMSSARQLGVEAFVKVMLPMAYIFVLIVWLTHVGACLFFAFFKDGSRISDTALSWRESMSEMSRVNDFISDLPEGYLYASSMYWTLVLLVAAESPEFPSNTAEAWFAYVYIFGGLFVQSSLVSSLSARLVDFNMRHQQRQREVSKLHRFLINNHIYTGLTTRIMYQITSRLRERHHVTVEDLTAINVLSVELREELFEALYGPIIAQHEFLRALDRMDESFMPNLCNSAVRMKTLEPGVVAFSSGEAAKNAIFVHSGCLSYRRGKSKATEGLQVAPGTWMCEMTLWLIWTTLGMADAIQQSEVLQVSEQDFAQVLSTRPELEGLVAEYSEALAASIDRERPYHLTDMGFLANHFMILKLMTETARSILRAPALEMLRKVSSRSHGGMLEREAHEGMCEFDPDTDGRLFRVVAQAVLHLTRSDNSRVWVELGDCDSDGFQPTFRHPSVLVRNGETPSEALQRFFDTEASNDVSCSLPSAWRRRHAVESFIDGNKQETLPTKHVQTVFKVELSDSSCRALRCVRLDLTEVMEPLHRSLHSQPQLVRNHSQTLQQDHNHQQQAEKPYVWDICMISEGCKLFAWMPLASFYALTTRSPSTTEALREKLERFMTEHVWLQVTQV